MYQAAKSWLNLKLLCFSVGFTRGDFGGLSSFGDHLWPVLLGLSQFRDTSAPWQGQMLPHRWLGSNTPNYEWYNSRSSSRKLRAWPKVDLSEDVVSLSSLFSFLRLPSFGTPFPHSAPTQAALADAVHDCCLIFSIRPSMPWTASRCQARSLKNAKTGCWERSCRLWTPIWFWMNQRLSADSDMSDLIMKRRANSGFLFVNRCLIFVLAGESVKSNCWREQASRVYPRQFGSKTTWFHL